jgi:predicted lipid-binding transport protein (Tim44 family)
VDEDETLHRPILGSVTKLLDFGSKKRENTVTNRWYAPAGMTPDAASSPHSLATASGLLLGALFGSMAVGALVGWALGGWGIGLLIGAVVGIPLGILVVYRVYSREGAV